MLQNLIINYTISNRFLKYFFGVSFRDSFIKQADEK